LPRAQRLRLARDDDGRFNFDLKSDPTDADHAA
jgi:hypothetical protein